MSEIVTPMMENRPYDTISFWHDTPDGMMTVHFVEEQGKLIQIIINIGKAGASVAAWAQLAADTITALLMSGAKPQTIMVMLSGITSGRSTRTVEGVVCRSGPEGLYICFMKYQRHKYQELMGAVEQSDSYDTDEDIPLSA